uniref:Uncharacterized protein n=1 Tax=Populus alba TaxID=43335 RepID=A0A4U5PQZ3_POPAL|nr:hypothetical protein D5086_0000198840 [Populus alba]
MAMAASKLLFFFCPIFINLLVLSIAQADPLYHFCSETGLIPECCNARQGGRVIYPSCNFRYEIDRFYDPSSNSIPPPPDSTSNNSIPSPPASTSQGKKGLKRNVIIIISIVPIAVSVILIVCVCIFLRARRKQKGEEEEEEEAEDLNEMEDVELLQLDFGTVRAATGNFSEDNKLGQGGFGVVYKIGGRGIGDEGEDLLTYSWRKWNDGTPLDIIDPTLIVGPRNEITRCIIIGLLCVQEKEALRPTMAQVSMMLSSYSVTLAAPSKPAFFMHREDSFPSSVNTSRLIESDESRTRSSRWSNNEVTISELDPR